MTRHVNVKKAERFLSAIAKGAYKLTIAAPGLLNQVHLGRLADSDETDAYCADAGG